MKISPFFKIEKAWEDTEVYWSTLNLFDSVPLDSKKYFCYSLFMLYIRGKDKVFMKSFTIKLFCKCLSSSQ